MEDDIYFKQRKLFNPHDSKLKVYVYGAGSIGSHVVIGLAKLGIKDITVIDYDKVEQSNVPAQFYKYDDRGYKVHDLHSMVKNMTKVEIKFGQVKVNENFVPSVEQSSIHIIAFDNIEGRKILIDKLEGFPVHIIDGRIGGFNWEKYYLNAREDLTEFKKTLEGTFSELECGEKCLWLVNAMISSKILADVVKLSKGTRPSYMCKGNAMADLVISKNG
jgi:molybdopterin/thiamine biosynthesis adenylyltransferase